MKHDLEFESPRFLYDKLKNDLNRFKQHELSAFYDFVIGANHLVERIEKDKTFSADSAITDRIKKSPEYKACKDAANKYKHFKLQRNYGTIQAKSESKGWGYEWGYNWGYGPTSISITLCNGTSLDAMELFERVLGLYQPLFEQQQQDNSKGPDT